MHVQISTGNGQRSNAHLIEKKPHSVHCLTVCNTQWLECEQVLYLWKLPSRLPRPPPPWLSTWPIPPTHQNPQGVWHRPHPPLRLSLPCWGRRNGRQSWRATRASTRYAFAESGNGKEGVEVCTLFTYSCSSRCYHPYFQQRRKGRLHKPIKHPYTKSRREQYDARIKRKYGRRGNGKGN